MNEISPRHEKTCFIPYANNKEADQPEHPRSLISAFVVRCLDSIIPLVCIVVISLRSLASVAEQAGLSLTWSESPKTVFFFFCDVPKFYMKWLMRLNTKSMLGQR